MPTIDWGPGENRPSSRKPENDKPKNDWFYTLGGIALLAAVPTALIFVGDEAAARLANLPPFENTIEDVATFLRCGIPVGAAAIASLKLLARPANRK